MDLLNRTMEAEANMNEDHFESIMEEKWLVLFYKSFENKYNPERRRALFDICQMK